MNRSAGNEKPTSASVPDARETARENTIPGLLHWPPFWFFILFSLAVCAVSYAAFLRYGSNIRQEELKLLATIADLKVDEITQWKKEREGDAVIFSRSPFLVRELEKWLQQGAPQDENRQMLVELTRLTQHTYGYREIILFDARGKPVLSSNPGAPPPAACTIELARQAIHAQTILTSDIGSDEAAGSMEIIATIFSGDRIIGAACLRMDASRFLAPLLKVPPSDHASLKLVLVRRDGDDVLFLNIPSANTAGRLLRQPLDKPGLPAAMAVSGIQGEVEGTDYQGVPVFAALRKIPGSGWALVTKVNREEADAPLRETGWLAAGAIAALIALSGLVVGLWWRNQRGEILIAEQKLAEQNLRNESVYTRSLIEASLDPLLTISAEGHILDVNHATEDATGLSRGKLVGADFSNCFTEPDRARAGYRQAFDRGLVRDYPLTLRHNSGRTMDVLYNATAYRDDAGNALGVFAAARDVTERKRAEEEVRQLNAELEQRVVERTAQLEAANQELESFAYSVSHDLRVPLRAIDGYSNLILKHYADQADDEGKRLLNVVRGNTKRMGQLIDDILAFSRAGRLEIKASEADMEAIVRDIWQEFEPMIAGREVILEIKPLPKARGDPAMLRQMWANLLANAVKFTKPKPTARIEIEASIEGAECLYSIKDNGAGFDQQYVHKLFGVFQRLHGIEEFEGTGIGLAIVKRIVIRHGGRIWAEGKPGEGAAFYFALPV